MCDSSSRHTLHRHITKLTRSRLVILVLLIAFVLATALVVMTVDQGPARERLADDLERLFEDPVTVLEAGYIEFSLRKRDVSFTVQFTTSDPSAYVLITGVQGPDGSWIYRNDGEADDEEEGEITSEFSDSIYGQYGDAALFMPLTPRQTLVPGRYRVHVDTEADSPLRSSVVVFKSGGRFLDRAWHVLDVNVWVAHNRASWIDELEQVRLEVNYRQILDNMLRPHGLSIGHLSLYRASEDEIDQYAVIDEHNDEQIQSACLAMLSRIENARALNVVMVETMSYVEDGYESGSAGFSSVPGPIFDTSTVNGCVFLSETAYVAGPSESLDQSMVDELHAATLLHEGAHFMSLEHPTESGGDNFDHFSDTPECDIRSYDGRTDTVTGEPGELDGQISEFECGLSGGADNVLFYSGGIDFAPFWLSPQQAWVLRRHPLFAPRISTQ